MDPDVTLGKTVDGKVSPARTRWSLVVFYDADCGFCMLCVRVLQAVDMTRLVTYKPAQFEPGERIVSVALTGEAGEGIEVMVQIAARSPMLWPLLPLLVLSRALFGQRPYDWVAARRHQIMRGACHVGNDHSR